MWLLATLYHHHELFNITDGFILDITPAWVDALVFSFLLFIVQFIIYIIIKIIKNNINKKSREDVF